MKNNRFDILRIYIYEYIFIYDLNIYLILILMNKLGRNDKCYCNSGKKYKSCCLNEDDNNKQKEINKLENGHEPNTDNMKIVHEFMSLKYNDHKVIDISDYINKQNYQLIQTKHMREKTILIVGKNIFNSELFQMKGIENTNVIIMYRGSYRAFNFNNLLQVENSIDTMMKSRLEWKVDKGG